MFLIHYYTKSVVIPMYLYQIQENKAEVYEVMLMNVDYNTRGGNLTTVKYWGIYLQA